jgi:hypothetical protein
MKKVTVSLFATIVLFASTCYAQEEFTKYNFHVGGGITFPTGSTSDIAGTNGAFQVGGGINVRKHLGLAGEFMWNGFSIKDSALRAIGAPGGNSNLYSITANFIAPFEGPKHIGVYGIVGGGWYHRTWAITAPSVGVGTVCTPFWTFWGAVCVNGLVPTTTILRDGSDDGGGFNVGAGITYRIGEGHVKFYTEARYHRAYLPTQDTQVIPWTFGFRW